MSDLPRLTGEPKVNDETPTKRRWTPPLVIEAELENTQKTPNPVELTFGASFFGPS